MSRKFLVLWALALAVAPGGAFSLGLGEIRLDSYLNQPLDAQIALSVASPEELESLQVGLASRDAFERYGLGRPAFLDGLRFDVERARGGAVVNVTSSQPIVEPFVTFLLEARWAGGRVLREYTVLLDPPVYLPGEQAAPAVEAPAPARSTPLSQPEPVAAPTPAAPAPRPATQAPAAQAPAARAPAAQAPAPADYGPVQRNETLWAIAERVRPDDSITMSQMMIALYRANPGAFDGNVNRLRAGAILRVPPRQEITSIDRGEASAEFRRQTQVWRAEKPQGPRESRLELVPPAETSAPAAPAAGPSTATTATGSGTADSAAQAELRAAVESLRGELDETRRAMELKDAEIAALQARLAELESRQAAGEPGEAPVGAAPGEAEPAAPAGEETQAAAEEEAAPAEPEPATTPPPAPTVVTPPSFMDRVLGFLGSLWFWVILGLVLVAGAALHFARNRGPTSSIEDDLAETGTWGTLDTPKAAAATAAPAPGGRREAPPPPPAEEPGPFEVGERPPAPAPVERESEAKPESAASDDDYTYPFEDTIVGETGINLDQSDPLAEADFHMAYGLYDQAAEIMKKAVERDPERYELRRKLLDICFVWGNPDEFLAQARAVREIGSEEQAADWGKIAIMGRQICPGEELFEDEAEVGEVDVTLETGDAESGEESAEGEEWLDFDVGSADESAVSLGDTQEQREIDEDRPPAEGDVTAEHTAELAIEDLGIDLDLGETGEHALQELADLAPEFSEETGEYIPVPGSEEPEEAGEDDEGTRVLSPEEQRRPDDSFAAQATGSDEDTQTEDEDTAEVELGDPLRLDDLTEGVDVDLDDVPDEEITQSTPTYGGGETDEDEEGPGGEKTQQMPVTMSEVGTKLDLARAYIDMGDPEGAKSILEEVLAEGDDIQKTEARELIESLG